MFDSHWDEAMADGFDWWMCVAIGTIHSGDIENTEDNAGKPKASEQTELRHENRKKKKTGAPIDVDGS